MMAVRSPRSNSQAAPRGQNARRPDVNAVLHPMAEQHRDQPGHAVARLGLGHKPRGNVADGRGMAEVIAHELLDRQQAGLGPIAAQLGDAELVGPIEHVGRLPGVEVQFVPQPQQELAGPLNRRQVFLAEHSPGVQLAEIGRAVADETDPADQLDVAQRAPRPLDVRLQQENRLAVTMLFLQPVVHDAGHEPAGAATAPGGGSGACSGRTATRCRRNSRDSTSDVQIIGSPQASRHACSRRPHAVAQAQAGVEHVAQQPLGQRRHAAAGGRADEGSSGRRRYRGRRRGVRSRRGPPGRSPTTARPARPRPDRPAPPRSDPAATSSRRSLMAAHSSTPAQPASWRRWNSWCPSASRCLAASTLERREDMSG